MNLVKERISVWSGKLEYIEGRYFESIWWGYEQLGRYV